MPSAFTLRSPNVSADASLQTLRRDPLLTGVANSGVRFIADTCFPWSYPGGAQAGRAAAAAPADQAVIYDVSENANGKIVKVGGQTISYAGGGFDFSALTERGSYLEAPASVAADIWATYGGASQRFMVCGYFKLPSLANWNTSGNAAPLLSFATLNAGVGNPDMITIAQTNGGGLMSFRQTGGATLAYTSVTPPAYDALAQVAFWRNASGVGLTVKVGATRVTTLDAVGTANTENFSGQTGRFGVGTAYWQPSLTGQTNARNFRVFRPFVENLARSGRDPLTVLDADWARVQARIAASAAANGGTSLIFV